MRFFARKTAHHPAARLFAACLICLAGAGLAAGEELPQVELVVRGIRITAEVAHTETSRTHGLMFREKLEENHGMLFVFPRPAPHGLWMVNTVIPLSAAFVTAEGVILNTVEMMPLTEDIYSSRGNAAYALEMPGGWFREHRIRHGQKIEGLEKAPPGQ